MEFELGQYKNLKSQQVEIENGLTVLVGTNGSGKSSFLEYLFINNDFDSSIVYSSGINESFTPKYKEYLNSLYWQSRRSIFSVSQSDEESVKRKFFFSKEWAPFLILAASFLSTSDSNIRKWMDHFSLKVASFDFQLYLPSSFRNKLKAAYEDLGEGRVDYGFESSRIVKFLSRLVEDDQEKLINDIRVDISWGSKENLTPNPRSTMNAIIFTQLFELSLFASSETHNEAINDFFQMLQVLSSGGSRSRYIPLDKSDIIFSKENNLVSLRNLSDGEFQILLNSALVDLFDNDESLFLLDEVDAHIHPTMIKKVWGSFDNIEGYVFTTSHNLLTISNSEYNRIVFLEDGTIISDTAKKLKLVDDICGTLFGAPIWKSLLHTVENLVLIDGLGDWEIFKELMIKINFDFENLDKRLLVVERSSGTNNDSRENLLKAKKIFVDELLLVAKKSRIPQNQINLKNIFFICDSDSYIYPGEGLDIRSGEQKKGNIRFNVHSIVWNRRNIESYLISPNARPHYDESNPEDFSWGELSGFGQLNENNLNEESIKRVNSKVNVQRFIGDDGFDNERMKEYISRMSDNEVDPYLTLVASKMIEIIEA